MLTATVNADRTATAADREAAAEREMAAYESYWHAHGVPAYAQTSASHGLIREHACRGRHRDPLRRGRARGFRSRRMTGETGRRHTHAQRQGTDRGRRSRAARRSREAQITREHFEACRLLGALPGMTHQERYAAGREPSAERGPEAAAGREDPEAGS